MIQRFVLFSDSLASRFTVLALVVKSEFDCAIAIAIFSTKTTHKQSLQMQVRFFPQICNEIFPYDFSLTQEKNKTTSCLGRKKPATSTGLNLSIKQVRVRTEYRRPCRQS